MNAVIPISTHKLPTGSVEATLGDLTVVVRQKDGFINATRLCKDGGKEFKSWYRLDSSNAFLEAMKGSVDSLIDISTGGENDKRGTWVHPKVAVDIAQWIQRNKRQRPSEGFVYLVTFPGSPRIKIGMWTSDLEKLRGRYSTVYGSDLQLHYWECEDARLMEQRIHREVEKYLISGEVFSRDAEEKARAVLQQITGSAGACWE